MAGSNSTSGRPLSPHLQVYRPMLTMMMSIFHRITGAALYFGTILLALWLLAVAAGPSSFDTINSFFGSYLGMLILFGYTWALIHHMIGGLRHFVWDLGKGFELDSVELMARMSIIGSLSLTVIIWAFALLTR